MLSLWDKSEFSSSPKNAILASYTGFPFKVSNDHSHQLCTDGSPLDRRRVRDKRTRVCKTSRIKLIFIVYNIIKQWSPSYPFSINVTPSLLSKLPSGVARQSSIAIGTSPSFLPFVNTWALKETSPLFTVFVFTAWNFIFGGLVIFAERKRIGFQVKLYLIFKEY